jgi:hypothetical protein
MAASTMSLSLLLNCFGKSVTRLIECLPTQRETLSSNPSTAKKKKKSVTFIKGWSPLAYKCVWRMV